MSNRSAQPNRRIWWWAARLLIGSLVVYSLIHLVYSLTTYFGESDFDVMLRYTRVFVETGQYPDYGRYTYPPLYFMTMLPWVSYDPMIVRCVAYILFAGLLVHATICAARLFEPKKLGWLSWLLIGVLVVNYQPFLEAVSAHSIESVELWLVVLALTAYVRGWKRVCGGLIMVAANLKFFPGIFLVYFLYKREWRVIQGALIGLAVVMLSIGLTFGPSIVKAHLLGTPMRMVGLETTNLGEASQGIWHTDNILNVSLRGTINRWFADPADMAMQDYGWGNIPIRRPLIAQWITLGLQGCLLGWMAWLFRRPLRSSRQVSLESIMILTLIFFITPASVSYYAVFLLPAVVWYVLEVRAVPKRVPRATIGCLTLWYVLVGNFLPLGILHYLPKLSASPYINNLYWYWWCGFPLLGEVFLLAGIAMALRVEHHRQDMTQSCFSDQEARERMARDDARSDRAAPCSQPVEVY